MQSLEELNVQRKELNEKLDCVIVSFAQATGTDYKSVAKLSYKLGRKKARKTRWSVTSKLIKKFKMKYVSCKRMQAKNFLKDAEFVKDFIVVSVRGHMFVAKQGEPIWGYENCEKCIVTGYYIKS